MIKLFDTVTAAPRWFEPHDKKNVSLYVCGPTVYDVPHLGNARTAVVFDVLFRILRRCYGDHRVTYARNYTDIDDKIIARANERGISIKDLTAQTVADYESAMIALNVLPPTLSPRATASIHTIDDLIEKLIDDGFAYESEGHVLFSVSAFAKYQLLSSTKSTVLVPGNDSLQNGARIEPASYKRDPEDFVLWKPSKEGEPMYVGPNGMTGRPGWHIECSAMIETAFGGKTIDIHGGGNDLKFPHHQCEIMQTEALGTKLANYWMHSGMLTVNGQKMSKSAGNFITVPDVLTKYPGETLRYFFLTGHYRQPLDFTWEALEASHKALDRLYRAYRCVIDETPGKYMNDTVMSELRVSDINTSQALATLHQFATSIFKNGGGDLRNPFIESAQLLGLFSMTPDEWFQTGNVDAEHVEEQIRIRNRARDQKDFHLADEIRNELLDRGIVLEDTPSGTTWSVR